MRLAQEDIVLSIGNTTVWLRPTLRAAARLERKHGLEALLGMIAEESLTAAVDLIRECSGACENTYMEIPEGLGLALAKITPALLDLTLGLVAYDPDAPRPEAGTSSPLPIADHIERLFGLATGWLGWTPAVAWDCTPAEILAAYEAHLDKLKALHGGGQAEEKPSNLTLDDQFARAFQRLGNRTAAA